MAMSVRKVKKARRLVTGLAKEMVKKGDTSERTATLAASGGRGFKKPLSEREKYNAGKRVVRNQAKKAINQIQSGKPVAPSTKEADVKRTTYAGRAGGLGMDKTNKVFSTSMRDIPQARANKAVKTEAKALKKGIKAVKKSNKAAVKAGGPSMSPKKKQ